MNLYYLNVQRQPTGPVTREQLDNLLRQGALSPETLVTIEGGTAWIPYRQLEDPIGAVVLPTLAAPPAPAPRPPTSSILRPAAAPAPTATGTPSVSSAENPFFASFTHPNDLGERLMAIGGAAGLISYVLPWVQVSNNNQRGSAMSFSGWNATTGSFGIGELLLIPAAAITAIVIAGKVHTARKSNAVRLARIPLAAGAAVAAISTLAALETQRLVNPQIVEISPGIGLWLTAIAFAVQAVGAWIVIEKRTA